MGTLDEGVRGGWEISSEAPGKPLCSGVKTSNHIQPSYFPSEEQGVRGRGSLLTGTAQHDIKAPEEKGLISNACR